MTSASISILLGYYEHFKRLQIRDVTNGGYWPIGLHVCKKSVGLTEYKTVIKQIKNVRNVIDKYTKSLKPNEKILE